MEICATADKLFHGTYSKQFTPNHHSLMNPCAFTLMIIPDIDL